MWAADPTMTLLWTLAVAHVTGSENSLSEICLYYIGKLSPHVVVGREWHVGRVQGEARSDSVGHGTRGVTKEKLWVSRRNPPVEGNLEQNPDSRYPRHERHPCGAGTVCDASWVWIYVWTCSLLPFSWCSWQTWWVLAIKSQTKIHKTNSVTWVIAWSSSSKGLCIHTLTKFGVCAFSSLPLIEWLKLHL